MGLWAKRISLETTMKTYKQLIEATRKSTPKHEVVHKASGTVAIRDVSKTDAKRFVKDMGDEFFVRPKQKIKKAET